MIHVDKTLLVPEEKQQVAYVQTLYSFSHQTVSCMKS